jgi:hypothetical protein
MEVLLCCLGLSQIHGHALKWSFCLAQVLGLQAHTTAPGSFLFLFFYFQEFCEFLFKMTICLFVCLFICNAGDGTQGRPCMLGKCSNTELHPQPLVLASLGSSC